MFVDTFYKFDGKYPADWPKNFKLPDECYLAKIPLTLSKPVNYKDVEAGTGNECWEIFCEGVCKKSSKDLVNYFRDQVNQAGYKVRWERDDPSASEKKWLDKQKNWFDRLFGKKYPFPNIWTLNSGYGGLGTWGIDTQVSYLCDMDGYTYFKVWINIMKPFGTTK